MNYYQIFLLKSSAPTLTYASFDTFNVGSVVLVPLKTTVKEAVILEEVDKPSFNTEEIVSVSENAYSAE